MPAPSSAGLSSSSAAETSTTSRASSSAVPSTSRTSTLVASSTTRTSAPATNSTSKTGTSATPRSTVSAPTSTSAARTTAATTAETTSTKTTTTSQSPTCTPSPTTELPASATWTLCPYVRRDGSINPDVKNLPDTGWITTMAEITHLSALAQAAGRSKTGYADAARFIRVWFTDPVTGVKPNLQYGQLVRGPGVENGTYTGILDYRWITKVANAVSIMRAANTTQWSAADDSAFNVWGKQYINWLTTSSLGNQAYTATNNHGTFYINQLAAMRYMVGDLQGAANALAGYFSGIYLNQILASGEQPLESVRAAPNHYQAFNIEAMLVRAIQMLSFLLALT
ncbi:hypothetical protein EXIGLDRAFT_840551 [Exidia glandulosa HHB12029]|uniref:Alginate lyase domain-containing protein n=1 Tax=Exidia glandulosa HHB12029 TaxID=1314781 RepID=A0A165EEB4_EXIGL|nr:hypothetical protein EXIGLDRAFT_840551 [Exidia glandulosa HHB12029]